MGVWGTGSFDNDAASDWAAELAGQNGLQWIEQALRYPMEIGDDYLDSDVACEAIAAAETLAQLHGQTGSTAVASKDVEVWLAAHRGTVTVPPRLLTLGQQAIARILAADSELNELWGETDEYEDWLAEIKSLQSRLAV